jgi:hypothetical protein
MQPKPYHIELRADTGFQPILVEDDVYAANDNEAVILLLSWKNSYIAAFLPINGVIAVCTNNWTEETIYQDVGTY